MKATPLRYKVPQDVQREDKILWFITFRQLIMLLIGFGISYMMFNSLTKSYHLNQIQMILIWIPAILSAAFAFLHIKGMNLFHFCCVFIEQVFFRARFRYWIAGVGYPLVSLCTNITSKKSTKKNSASIPAKTFDLSEVNQVAHNVDQN